MYELVYSENFFYNFFPSFLLIFSLTLVSFYKSNSTRNNLQILGKSRPIIIFYGFFALSTIIFNFLIISENFDILKILKFFLFSFSIISLFYIKFLINYIKDIKINRDKFLILFLLILFFLISILPLSDADSIAVHLRAATHIFFNGLKNLDFTLNHEFLSISNTEILLLFSPILKSDNFGSQLNLFSLIIFILVFRNKFSFVQFIVSCPLILFLISTQKLQLFFGILYLYLFILVFEKKIKSKLEIFVFLFLLAFYTSGKINYVLFSIPLYLYYLLSYKNFFKFNIIVSFSVFVIILLPIYFLKFKYFGNPIAPFFDNIFGSSRIIFQEYEQSLKNSQGWLNNFRDISIYIKPFLPTKLSDATNTLGLIFLLFFFNFKLQKKLNYFPFLLTVLVLATGQILPRYYLEAFLLLVFFYNNNKKNFIFFLQYVQFIFIAIVCSIFIYLSYFKSNVVFNKDYFMKNFSYGYSNFSKYNQYLEHGNVFLTSDGRGSIFSKQGLFHRTSLEIQKIKLDNPKELTLFFKKNNINVYISKDDKYISDCINYNIIENINLRYARRNFLVKKIDSFNVYKIDLSQC